jgi:hypothetical protein
MITKTDYKVTTAIFLAFFLRIVVGNLILTSSL